jgi:hypothetical protein
MIYYQDDFLLLHLHYRNGCKEIQIVSENRKWLLVLMIIGSIWQLKTNYLQMYQYE